MINIITMPNAGGGGLWLGLLNLIQYPAGKTCLDLCCGEMTHTRQLGYSEIVGVDAEDWPNRPKEYEFHQADVIEWLRRNDRQFDVCICSDGIEHLRYDQGKELKAHMLKFARVGILFFPTGGKMIDEDSKDVHTHKSEWGLWDFDDPWQGIDFPNWHSGFGAMMMWFNKGPQ